MYFTNVETDPRKAQCTECNNLQTVSGLKGHLTSCYKELHGMYLMRTISIEGTVTKHALPNFVQTSLTSMEESRMPWPEDHIAVQQINKCIMDLIIAHKLPYPTVEGDEFKRLNIGDPLSTRHCRVKSEEYYRTMLMPATYDKVVKHVMNLLQEAAGISFTMDGRSNPTKSCSMLSFTAHFIHTAVWPKVIWSVMNAANMKSARKLAGVTDISCTSHTLQLVLHGALFTLCKHECKLRQACRHLVEHQLTMILQTTAADQGLNQMKVALRHAMCCRFSFINSSASYVAAMLIDLCYNDSYINVQEKMSAIKVVQDFLCLSKPANSEISNAEEELNIWAACDSHQYPLRGAAPCKYLSVPPTSVGSDQLFITAGQLCDDRLLGYNAETLLFLNYNIRLFEFNY
ncbi:hypothetical protein ACJMK2_001229 [Sinanodonta woodiana]|uniref:HAT C-terminal dimerisation domain-containing protein n=1 Tax=Sinanodonta woodiana TaxID=1069815 RepID=A0ABD3XRM4_SINWO